MQLALGKKPMHSFESYVKTEKVVCPFIIPSSGLSTRGIFFLLFKSSTEKQREDK